MMASRWGIDPLPEEDGGISAWTNWWFSNLGPVVVLVCWALIIRATTWIREVVTRAEEADR